MITNGAGVAILVVNFIVVVVVGDVFADKGFTFTVPAADMSLLYAGLVVNEVFVVFFRTVVVVDVFGVVFIVEVAVFNVSFVFHCILLTSNFVLNGISICPLGVTAAHRLTEVSSSG